MHPLSRWSSTDEERQCQRNPTRVGRCWHLNSDGHLERVYRLQNFVQAMSLPTKWRSRRRRGHHPDLYIGWGKCKVEIWMHKISGLTESDFYFAAKRSRLQSLARVDTTVRHVAGSLTQVATQ